VKRGGDIKSNKFITKNVGRFNSLAVTPSNVAYIAYTNDTDTQVKLAAYFNNVYLPLLIR
jgi:hypothetical protein